METANEITAETLEKINRYCVKKLTADEVFCFNVILCDNDIDRDTEKFTRQALEQLGELFKGKTGIMDHDPKCKNQQARIYHTEVIEYPDRKTADNENYCALMGYAYMVRTEENKDFICQIEGGIKKEISVSCKMGRQICSVCGSDRNANPCMHVKGNSYGGKLCYVTLEQPLDAYEWSFVAVPAQKNAGVTKKFLQGENNICKKSAHDAHATDISDEEKREKLCEEILKLSYFAKPFETPQAVSMTTKNLDLNSLRVFKENLEKQTENYSQGSFISEEITNDDDEEEKCYKL